MVAAGGGCQVAAKNQNAEGVRLYKSGQYTAALQKFQQARSTSPEDPDAYYNMAATYHQLAKQQQPQQAQPPDANFRQAETLYNQCLDLDENHVECHRALAVLLVETNRQDAAFRLMTNWTTNSPQSSDARVELARLYQEVGDSETAQLQLQNALAIDQDNPRAWAALGYLREQAGDLNQALANYQRSYEINNMQPAVATRIASINQSLGGTAAGASGATQTATPAMPAIRY